MTSERPKRRFWQIHLLTAVIGVLVAGTLIGLNFYVTPTKEVGFPIRYSLGDDVDMMESFGIVLLGWPINAVTCLILLFGSMLLTEALLRRQERQQRAENGFADRE